MKFIRSGLLTHFVMATMIMGNSACSGLKTRKEAAEEAKIKPPAAESAQTPMGMAPIEEGSDDGAVDALPTAVDDQFLNDELAALGIDASQTEGGQRGTPEPEAKPATPVVRKSIAPSASEKKKPKKPKKPKKTTAKK